MKFSAIVSSAAVAIGGTSVQARKRGNSKSPKSSDASLEEYCYTEPANFEGVYDTCWYSVIRNSFSGFDTGTFHVCFDENTPDWVNNRGRSVLTKTDAYGAYQSVTMFNPVEFVDNLAIQHQGFAKGDTISLTTFGVGGIPVNSTTDTPIDNSNSTNATEILTNNDLPDSKVCKLRKGGIMECTDTVIEYCSPASLLDFTKLFCEGRIGQWMVSYTLYSVFARDIANCPSPPEGFCKTNPVPPLHPLDPNNPNGPPSFGTSRHLEDNGDGSRHPCPVLAAGMDD